MRAIFDKAYGIDNGSISNKYKAFLALFIIEAMLFAYTPWFTTSYKNNYRSNFSALKSREHIIDVQAIGQLPELPSGCEPTAAAMLLNWAGANVTKQDVAKAIPKGPLPAVKNGVMKGSSPDDVFIGDPFSSNGLGAYHEVIANLINKYLPDRADDVSGASFEDILSIIDSGRPVMVWSTMNLSEPASTTVWYDGSSRKVDWKAPEHAYLLVGYTDNEVCVNDPYTGKRQSYPTPLFKKRWEQMGRQAVTISQLERVNMEVSHSLTGSDRTPAASNNMKSVVQGINITGVIENIGRKAVQFKDVICGGFLKIKNIHIVSKLCKAADLLYRGVMYIADNM